MRYRSLLLSIFAVLLGLLAGCGEDSHSHGDHIHVVATTGMIADAARAIGGKHVEVHALMGPGVDPHLYAASRSDQRRLQQADLALYHGLHLEGKMADYLKSLAAEDRAGRLVVAVGESVDASKLFRDEAAADYPDPHIWFDLTIWKTVVVAVRDALEKRLPDHSKHFRDAAEKYLGEIEATHQWALAQVERIPSKRRRIVTSHDAYRYFAKAYGFEVRGLQGISTETEPGLQRIRDTVTYIRTHEIPVIFAETSVRRDAVEQVARESGCEVCEHELYSDALGKPGSGAESFLGMFRSNVETIVGALSPARTASDG